MVAMWFLNAVVTATFPLILPPLDALGADPDRCGTNRVPLEGAGLTTAELAGVDKTTFFEGVPALERSGNKFDLLVDVFSF